MLAGHQQRGGEVAQRPLGGRAPPLLPFQQVHQFAREGHPVLRHAGGRGNRGPVFNARRRQQGFARLQGHQFLLSRGEFPLAGRVGVERLEPKLLQGLRIVLQLGGAGRRLLVRLIPAFGRPLELQPGVGQRLRGLLPPPVGGASGRHAAFSSDCSIAEIALPPWLL